MQNNKPIIGITMGDPAGVGPEIAIKASAYKKVYDKCRPLIIGDAKVIQSCMHHLQLKQKVNPVQDQPS